MKTQNHKAKGETILGKEVMTPLSKYTRRLASGILFKAYDADRILNKALKQGNTRFAFAWVRGLGDVAFILNEFTRYIHQRIPGAIVSAFVRPGLEDACGWIEGLKEVIPVGEWSREKALKSLCGYAFPPAWEIKRIIRKLGMKGDFDSIIPYPLGKWYDREPWRRKPFLKWTEEERQFGENSIRTAFPKEPKFVISLNTHTGTESFYSFNKEWGLENFSQLINHTLQKIPESHIILVDAKKTKGLPMNSRILDVRGTLSVSHSLSVIASSDLFICLDAGAVNLLYFMKGISLTILVLLGRTSCFSPLRYPPASPELKMMTIIGEGEDMYRISPDTVLSAMNRVYRQWLEEKERSKKVFQQKASR